VYQALSLFQVERSEIHELPDKSDSPFKTQFTSMGISGGFTNTQELHMLNNNQAMKSQYKEKWLQAINEHKHMLKHGVFKPTCIGSLLLNVKPIVLTWAMKKVGRNLQSPIGSSWIQTGRRNSLQS
jgi:hypothetical protein